MAHEGPVIYGPEPPERDDMTWIIMKRSSTISSKKGNILESDRNEMQAKLVSSSSLNLGIEQKKSSFTQCIVSSLETHDVKPTDDGSKFKILSCYDSDTRTMTVWNHSCIPTPKKYIAHLTSNSEKTSSCPSLASLLSDSSINGLPKEK